MKEIQALFEAAPFGYALYEVISDDAGVPVDFSIIDLNGKFEEITGVCRDSLFGARHSDVEIIPEARILKLVATEDTVDEGEYYSKACNSWY